MLKRLYRTDKNQSATDYNIALLGEAIDLCFRLSEFVIRSTGTITFAHEILNDAKIVHRLPEADAAEAVELLADVADLRTVMESQVEMLTYRRSRDKALNNEKAPGRTV